MARTAAEHTAHAHALLWQGNKPMQVVFDYVGCPSTVAVNLSAQPTRRQTHQHWQSKPNRVAASKTGCSQEAEVYGLMR
jgi:hypothetical protein